MAEARAEPGAAGVPPPDAWRRPREGSWADVRQATETPTGHPPWDGRPGRWSPDVGARGDARGSRARHRDAETPVASRGGARGARHRGDGPPPARCAARGRDQGGGLPTAERVELEPRHGGPRQRASAPVGARSVRELEATEVGLPPSGPGRRPGGAGLPPRGEAGYGHPAHGAGAGAEARCGHPPRGGAGAGAERGPPAVGRGAGAGVRASRRGARGRSRGAGLPPWGAGPEPGCGSPAVGRGAGAGRGGRGEGLRPSGASGSRTRRPDAGLPPSDAGREPDTEAGCGPPAVGR
ncbi:hypothetical protein EV567_4247 [Streptomyces sp. BK239]|nr:hypothetical protein EV567_4247 [Streptomyces sp. BK239]